jgi:hypothetical protein
MKTITQIDYGTKAAYPKWFGRIKKFVDANGKYFERLS